MEGEYSLPEMRDKIKMAGLFPPGTGRHSAQDCLDSSGLLLKEREPPFGDALEWVNSGSLASVYGIACFTA